MRNRSEHHTGESLARRDFLTLGLSLAAATALPSGLLHAHAPTSNAGALGRRKLGALEVSRLGLGCMSMAGVYNVQPDRQEMVALIRAAYDHGVTFFDTAEVYGPFISEDVVGEALEPLKGKVQIASKFGFDVQAPGAPGQSMAAGRRRDSSPEHIRGAIEGSLKRLRVETIDLYYQHRADPQVPVEDVAGAVKALVQAGKVRHFGLSEMSPVIADRRRDVVKLPVEILAVDPRLVLRQEVRRRQQDEVVMKDRESESLGKPRLNLVVEGDPRDRELPPKPGRDVVEGEALGEAAEEIEDQPGREVADPVTADPRIDQTELFEVARLRNLLVAEVSEDRVQIGVQ